MAHYYCLMAGAPALALDGSPSPLTPAQFREQFEEVASEKDRQLLSYFFLKQDCLNVADLLADPDAPVDAEGGNFSLDQLHDLILSAQTMNFNVHRYPAFLSEFARSYPTLREQPGYYPKDDVLSRYYSYAAEVPNKVMKAWFELNLNITNILTALIAKGMGWDVKQYIQGENDTCEMILTSNAKDFNLSVLHDYAAEVVHISEEQNPTTKEQRIDALKWTWLNDNALEDEFSIEAVFAYLCKLDMLRRWEILDPEKGKATFTQIIEDLRAGAEVPAEFQTVKTRR